MIKLPRLNSGWADQPGLFERYWNTAMTTIEQNINDIITALTAAASAQDTADGAQISADDAQSSADTAQTTANTALVSVNTKVSKSLGPVFSNATGTASRTAYPSYAGQTVSALYTQAEVQAIDDQVKALSQHVVAIINDLKNNQSLT